MNTPKHCRKFTLTNPPQDPVSLHKAPPSGRGVQSLGRCLSGWGGVPVQDSSGDSEALPGRPAAHGPHQHRWAIASPVVTSVISLTEWPISFQTHETTSNDSNPCQDLTWTHLRWPETLIWVILKDLHFDFDLSSSRMTWDFAWSCLQ